MDRRQFLSSSLAFAAGGATLSRPQQAIAKGGKLRPPADGVVKVAIAVSRGTTWIDFVGPLAAFETWHYDPVEKKHKPQFKTFLVAEKMDVEQNLAPDYTFATAPEADVILIPAQRGSPALQEWLKKSLPDVDLMMSVCIGAVHLAEAGLLDGHEATTHHESMNFVQKRFPSVRWVKDMRFVEGKKISTGGGLTAGIDLGLRVVERYFGREEAKAVAKHLEYSGTGWIV